MEDKTVFQTKKAIDLIRPNIKVISVDSKETLNVALEKLAKNNIYSAPVYDAEKKEWLGFIALQDIVKAIIHFFGTAAKVSEDFAGISQAKWTPEQCVEIEKKIQNYCCNRCC